MATRRRGLPRCYPGRVRMHGPAVLLCAALLPAIAGWSPAVRAQTAGEPTAETRKQASQAFADAERAFKEGDYKAAGEAYERAYAVLPHYAALWNAARSWQRAGDLAHAANLYTRYLAEAPPHARDRNNAIKALNDLSTKLGHLEVHAQDMTGLKVDGTPITGTDVFVTPGAHVLEARASDGQTVHQSQNVEAGQEVSVSLTRGPASPAAPPSTAPAPEPAPTTSDGSMRKWSPVTVYFGGAVTLALTGLTVWSGLDTLSQKDAYDRNQTSQNLDSGRQAQTRTNDLLAGTLVVAAFTGAAAIFLVDWHPHPTQEGDVHVGVGPGSLLVRGDF